MTREEAIKIIDKGLDIGNQMPFLTVDQMNEAKQKAIKALEQKPCSDAISRQAAIDIIAETDITNGEEPVFTGRQVQALLKDLPSVNPQEPSDISNDGTLTVNVEDGRKISRVLVCGANHWGGLYYPDEQEPKTGHWIEQEGYDGDTYYDCSECGDSWTTIDGTPWQNGMNYCPNCGVKMIEPQESEEHG